MKSPNKGASCVQQRQRERLQIEPCESFGVVGIEPMPLDAVLAELIEMAVTQTRQRRAPVAVRYSAANVSLGTWTRFGMGHRRILQPLVYQMNLSIVGNF